jgi:GNAT superfamily N-acetyltransferase
LLGFEGGGGKSFAVGVAIAEDAQVSLVVRRILRDEGSLLRDMRLAALQESPSAFASSYEVEAQRTAQAWEERARLGSASNDRATFLAVLDGRVVGIVGGFRGEANSTVVDLVSMWTSPEARRSGVGRALVNAVIDWAAAVSATAVDLWVTRGNEPAFELYKALRFRETGEYQALPSDPCEDEIRMTRAL